METFFGVLTNGVIVISLLIKISLMIKTIIAADYPVEQIIRASAFSSGILIFFGAKAFGISIADLIFQAIQFYSSTFYLVGTVLPAVLGYVVAWYTINSLKRSTNIAIRIMILVGTLTVVQFADVYFKAVGIAGFKVDQALLPNLSFTLSVSIYTIFRYDPQ